MSIQYVVHNPKTPFFSPFFRYPDYLLISGVLLESQKVITTVSGTIFLKIFILLKYAWSGLSEALTYLSITTIPCLVSYLLIMFHTVYLFHFTLYHLFIHLFIYLLLTISNLFCFYYYILFTLHTEYPQSLPPYPTEGEFLSISLSFSFYLFITVEYLSITCSNCDLFVFSDICYLEHNPVFQQFTIFK